jgi:hypothetical protein
MTGVGCRIAGGQGREGALAGDGWTRRSIAALTRLDELVELYRSLGFEIRVEPLDLDDMEPRCAGCSPDLVDCRAVYTRPACAVSREPSFKSDP